MTWPKKDLFAVTVDGEVLINIRALDEENPPPLALQKNVFVGVPLTPTEKKALSEQTYDAHSALAAAIASERRKRGGRKKQQ